MADKEKDLGNYDVAIMDIRATFKLSSFIQIKDTAVLPAEQFLLIES